MSSTNEHSSNLPQLIKTVPEQYGYLLQHDALRFIGNLAEQFVPQLEGLLSARKHRQQEVDAGRLPDFDVATSDIRNSDYKVAEIPEEVLDRRTEITGPVNRKMVINALNSGAQVYMADFEDSTAPSWENQLDGQHNLYDAVRRQIDFTTSRKAYRLAAKTAVLMVRPRGLHLPEAHVLVNGQPMPGCLFDFGLYLFHNHQALSDNGSRPYLYLPKLEHHAEAAWWAEVFQYAEQALAIPAGTIRATVLIETLPAVFQMDEILYSLRNYILGLNCGRWDYIFSYIKTLRNHPDRVLPDRHAVGMDTPFLDAYSKLLIHTCHRRGAFAMGGMAAQIPIKDNPEANSAALNKVKADKQREAGNGHDGTWVAHPALEPLARAEFDLVLNGPNQIGSAMQQQAATTTAAQLLYPPTGEITEAGIDNNISVAVLYLTAWISGNGCVPINHLMEDAATAEIARAQLWQWRCHQVSTSGGQLIDEIYLQARFNQVLPELKAMLPEVQQTNLNKAAEILHKLVFDDSIQDFLTIPAYVELIKVD